MPQIQHGAQPLLSRGCKGLGFEVSHRLQGLWRDCKTTLNDAAGGRMLRAGLSRPESLVCSRQLVREWGLDQHIIPLHVLFSVSVVHACWPGRCTVPVKGPRPSRSIAKGILLFLQHGQPHRCHQLYSVTAHGAAGGGGLRLQSQLHGQSGAAGVQGPPLFRVLHLV